MKGVNSRFHRLWEEKMEDAKAEVYYSSSGLVTTGRARRKSSCRPSTKSRSEIMWRFRPRVRLPLPLAVAIGDFCGWLAFLSLAVFMRMPNTWRSLSSTVWSRQTASIKVSIGFIRWVDECDRRIHASCMISTIQTWRTNHAEFVAGEGKRRLSWLDGRGLKETVVLRGRSLSPVEP